MVKETGVVSQGIVLSMNCASLSRPPHRQMPHHKWWPVIHTVTWFRDMQIKCSASQEHTEWSMASSDECLSKFWISQKLGLTQLICSMSKSWWPAADIPDSVFKPQELARVMIPRSPGQSQTFPLVPKKLLLLISGLTAVLVSYFRDDHAPNTCYWPRSCCYLLHLGCHCLS